jgi:hypothetical protein
VLRMTRHPICTTASVCDSLVVVPGVPESAVLASGFATVARVAERAKVGDIEEQLLVATVRLDVIDMPSLFATLETVRGPTQHSAPITLPTLGLVQIPPRGSTLPPCVFAEGGLAVFAHRIILLYATRSSQTPPPL